MCFKEIKDIFCILGGLYILWCTYKVRTLILVVHLSIMLLNHLYRYGPESGVDAVSEDHRFDLLYQELIHSFYCLQTWVERLSGRSLSKNPSSRNNLQRTQTRINPNTLQNNHPPCSLTAFHTPPRELDDGDNHPNAEEKLVVSTAEAKEVTSQMCSSEDGSNSNNSIRRDHLLSDNQRMDTDQTIPKTVIKCQEKFCNTELAMAEFLGTEKDGETSSLGPEKGEKEPLPTLSNASAQTDDVTTGNEELPLNVSNTASSFSSEDIINPKQTVCNNGGHKLEKDEESIKEAEGPVHQMAGAERLDNEDNVSSSHDSSSEVITSEEKDESPVYDKNLEEEGNIPGCTDDIPLGKTALKLNKNTPGSKPTEAVKPVFTEAVTYSVSTVSLASGMVKMEAGKRAMTSDGKHQHEDKSMAPKTEGARSSGPLATKGDGTTAVFSPINDQQKMTATNYPPSSNLTTVPNDTTTCSSNAMIPDNQLDSNPGNVNNGRDLCSEGQPVTAAVAVKDETFNRSHPIDLAQDRVNELDTNGATGISVSLSSNQGIPDTASNPKGNEDMDTNLEGSQTETGLDTVRNSNPEAVGAMTADQSGGGGRSKTEASSSGLQASSRATDQVQEEYGQTDVTDGHFNNSEPWSLNFTQQRNDRENAEAPVQGADSMAAKADSAGINK